MASPVEPRWIDGIREIRGSMFFCDPQIPQSLLPRAKLGLKRAIDHKRIVHMFLHPWNLLLYQRLRDNLEKILRYVSKKRYDEKLEVTIMKELAEHIDSGMNYFV